MEALQALSDALFAIKEKLTSGEYLEIMNLTAKLTQPKINPERLELDFRLEPCIASYIAECLNDPEYSNIFCFVGEPIPAHLIFDAESSGEEWSPARSHPYATRSRTL